MRLGHKEIIEIAKQVKQITLSSNDDKIINAQQILLAKY